MPVDLTELFANVIISILGLAVLWLTHKAERVLKARAEAEEAEKGDKIIYQIVAAAEQTLKADDPTGQKRMAYTLDLLTQLGFEINKAMMARVEAAVYGLNQERELWGGKDE